MTDGITWNGRVLRVEADVRFDRKLVEDVAQCARWFTSGSVELSSAGMGLQSMVYRIDDDTSYIGRDGARQTCAYFIGAMQGWVRLSNAEIPEEMTPFLRDVQNAYRAGLTDRYANEEAAGAEAARVAWENRRDR